MAVNCREESGRIDLHLHSTHSDGLLAPSDVVDLAVSVGLDVMALTDHDTFAGLPVAAARAAERGIELIAGVEISTNDARGIERHLLAYGVDPEHPGLREEMDLNLRGREDRVQGMVDALATIGVRITADDVLAEAKGSVGRPHVADALVRAGHVKTRQEAFDRWLGDGKVGHVRKRNTDVLHAIQLVHDAGGVAVLAHPGRRWDPAFIEELVRHGLDGVEVHHPTNSATERNALGVMAQRWGLLMTGGSDNHGDREGMNAMKASRVPRALATALLARVEARRVAAAAATPPAAGRIA